MFAEVGLWTMTRLWFCVYTVIWFYFVLYFISYAAVRTKIKRTNIFQQLNFHTCFIYDMGSVRN